MTHMVIIANKKPKNWQKNRRNWKKRGKQKRRERRQKKPQLPLLKQLLFRMLSKLLQKVLKVLLSPNKKELSHNQLNLKVKRPRKNPLKGLKSRLLKKMI